MHIHHIVFETQVRDGYCYGRCKFCGEERRAPAYWEDLKELSGQKAKNNYSFVRNQVRKNKAERILEEVVGWDVVSTLRASSNRNLW